MNPLEQALPSPADVVYTVAHASYPVSFAAVCGWDPVAEIT